MAKPSSSSTKNKDASAPRDLLPSSLQQGWDQLMRWKDGGAATTGRLSMPYRVLLGVMLVVLGVVVATLTRNMIHARSFRRETQALSKEQQVLAAIHVGHHERDPSTLLLGTVIYWVIIAIVVTALFMLLGLRAASIIGVGGLLSIGVGIAMQGILQDITSGIIIALSRVFIIGEVIEVMDTSGNTTVSGVVVGFDLINTTLLDFNSGTRVTVPNRTLQSMVLTNHTRHGQRVVDVDVRVANSTNKDFVGIAAKLRDALMHVSVMEQVAPPVVGVQSASEMGTIMRVALTIRARDYTSSNTILMQLQVRQALQDLGVTLVDPCTA